MDILCVAPLREVDPYRIKGRNVFGGLGMDTQFASRETDTAVITRPTVTQRFEVDNQNVRDARLYEHTGMRFLVATISTQNLEDVVAFEQYTTDVFEDLCAKHCCTCGGDHQDLDDKTEHVAVRWVNRTLQIGKDGAIPSQWFQQERAQLVPLAGSVSFHANWGNNVLAGQTDLDMAEPIVHAQFLWCYLTDIERISLGYLKMLNSGQRIRDELIHGVVDLHFELAMESVIRERTRTESQPWFRQVVEAILTSWGYDEVHADVDRRLGRLEHIVEGRSELLARSQSRTMEITLFVLGALTLVALAISLLQTAYAEISTGDDSVRPGGGLFDLMRHLDASALVWWSLGISFAIIALAMLWPTAKHQYLRKGRNVRVKRFAPRRK